MDFWDKVMSLVSKARRGHLRFDQKACRPFETAGVCDQCDEKIERYSERLLQQSVTSLENKMCNIYRVRCNYDTRCDDLILKGYHN